MTRPHAYAAGFRAWRFAVSCLFFASIPTTAALAQDEEDAEETGVKTLPQVKVTAQKREENPQDIPITISTLTGENLEFLTASGEDVKVLAGRLPSLQIESSFGRAFPRFYIRGYGNTDFDLNASQPVSLVYDEIVQENPILKGFPMFDMDRVEMLRGPQGTLFGRNTPAGIVKFDSRKPSQEIDGYARIGYGTFDSINFEGALGGGISEDWAGRVSVLYERRDDWVDNGFTGESNALEGYDDRAARVQFLYDGANDFTALFNLHARSLDGTARLFRANIIQPGSNELVPDFDRDIVYYDGLNDQDLDAFGGIAKLEWNLGTTTFTSVTGYESVEVLSRGDIDGGSGAAFIGNDFPPPIPFPAESADGLPDHEQWTQEFRLSSNEWGVFDWQAGFFWFDEDITIDTFNYDSLAPGNPQNGSVQQMQETSAWALFASADMEVTENLDAKVGLRYSDDEKDFVAERFQSPIGAGPVGPITVNPSDSEVSWDASLIYWINDDVNFYGRVARGFRAPSIQGRLLFGDIVTVADSEIVHSYEIGMKASFWNNRARANVTLFQYTVDDAQLTAVGGETNFNQLLNAEEVNGSGIELDLSAYLTDNLLIGAIVSYNDTEIDDPGLAVQGCGGGCTVIDPAAATPGLFIIDGNPLPNAPEWIANINARYGIPMGTGELYFYGDWAYRDEIRNTLYESLEFNHPSLSEFGLRVGYNWEYGKHEVAGFVRNLTDEEEAIYAIDFNNLTGVVNDPRTWGIEYIFKY